MAKKGILVNFLDINLVGTFKEFIEEGTEEGYVRLRYVPLDSFRVKGEILERPIKKTDIYHVHSTHKFKGVELEVIYIFEGRDDSVLKKVIGENMISTIKELRDKVDEQQKEIASLKKQSTDARSGVAKTIKEINDLGKASRNSFNDFGSPVRNEFNNSVGNFPQDDFLGED